MSLIHYHNLRAVRKQSPLKQSDIAFFLGTPEDARISHWEKGRRTPGIEVKILYHILFNLPLASIVEEVAGASNSILIERLQKRIEHLQPISNDARNKGRMEYLQAVLTRLTS